MKVNFNRVFVDNLGQEINEKRNIAEQLSMYLFNLSSLSGVPLPGDKKYTAYCLCRRISANPEDVDISTEEATFIKDVCADVLSSGAYGQVVDIIEGNNV